MSDALLNNLVIFLKGQTGIRAKNITREKRLEEDLGITGDDAVELIDAFCKKYNVECNIELYEYITPENAGLTYNISLFICKLRGIKPIRKTKSINIGDLENAILNKKFIC